MAKPKPWMKLKQDRSDLSKVTVEIDRRGKWVWMERECLRQGKRVIHTASGRITITRAADGHA